MKPTVYLETSVVSYLAARPSRDLIVAAHQQITSVWWEKQRPHFDFLVSPFVVDEVRQGDPTEAARREKLLAGMKVLDISGEVLELAEEYNRILQLPIRKKVDALHLATASWHGVNYVLTWNCKHIASAQVRRALFVINAARKLSIPVLCTPEELEA